MGYHYLNTSDDTPGSYTLPNVVVDYLPWQPHNRRTHCEYCGELVEQTHESFEHAVCEQCYAPGYFWAFGFPGCLNDSEYTGPFDTEQEAIDDCRAFHAE